MEFCSGVSTCPKQYFMKAKKAQKKKQNTVIVVEEQEVAEPALQEPVHELIPPPQPVSFVQPEEFVHENTVYKDAVSREDKAEKGKAELEIPVAVEQSKVLATQQSPSPVEIASVEPKPQPVLEEPQEVVVDIPVPSKSKKDVKKPAKKKKHTSNFEIQEAEPTIEHRFEVDEAEKQRLIDQENRLLKNLEEQNKPEVKEQNKEQLKEQSIAATAKNNVEESNQAVKTQDIRKEDPNNIVQLQPKLVTIEPQQKILIAPNVPTPAIETKAEVTIKEPEPPAPVPESPPKEPEGVQLTFSQDEPGQFIVFQKQKKKKPVDKKLTKKPKVHSKQFEQQHVESTQIIGVKQQIGQSERLKHQQQHPPAVFQIPHVENVYNAAPPAHTEFTDITVTTNTTAAQQIEEQGQKVKPMKQPVVSIQPEQANVSEPATLTFESTENAQVIEFSLPSKNKKKGKQDKKPAKKKPTSSKNFDIESKIEEEITKIEEHIKAPESKPTKIAEIKKTQPISQPQIIHQQPEPEVHRQIEQAIPKLTTVTLSEPTVEPAFPVAQQAYPKPAQPAAPVSEEPESVVIQFATPKKSKKQAIKKQAKGKKKPVFTVQVKQQIGLEEPKQEPQAQSKIPQPKLQNMPPTLKKPQNLAQLNPNPQPKPQAVAETKPYNQIPKQSLHIRKSGNSSLAPQAVVTQTVPPSTFRKSQPKPNFHKSHPEDAAHLSQLLSKVEFKTYHNERQNILRQTVSMLREDILSRLMCRKRSPVNYDAEEIVDQFLDENIRLKREYRQRVGHNYKGAE